MLSSASTWSRSCRNPARRSFRANSFFSILRIAIVPSAGRYSAGPEDGTNRGVGHPSRGNYTFPAHPHAGMAELVDAPDSKSGVLWTCGFESRSRYGGSPAAHLLVATSVQLPVRLDRLASDIGKGERAGINGIEELGAGVVTDVEQLQGFVAVDLEIEGVVIDRNLHHPAEP